MFYATDQRTKRKRRNPAT